MSEDTKKVANLMPPFQALLTEKLPEIYDSWILFSDGSDPWQIWYRLESLYQHSPREIANDMKKQVETIKVELANCPKTRDRIYEQKVLFRRIPELDRITTDTLDDHGYMRQLRGYGQIPESKALSGKSKKTIP